MVGCPTELLFQQPFLTCAYSARFSMTSSYFDQPGYSSLIEAQAISKKEDYRQWPLRGLAFTSDLGTVGYLVKQPWLGLIGWMLALPYYVYALWRQPDSKSHKEEVVYHRQRPTDSYPL